MNLSTRTAAKIGGYTLLAYVVVVIGFEIFVVMMGNAHAERGVSEDENWVTLTTFNAQGEAIDTIMGGVRVNEQLYVAANHWPRAWINRAIARPDVLVTLRGQQENYRAFTLDAAERAEVVEVYRFPFLFRMLTGFPPRVFLRLEPSTT